MTLPSAARKSLSAEAGRNWQMYPPIPTLPVPVVGDAALPLVSIVTPSYNQGQFIRETIESVLHQDYPNIEYWVIDGGSTDDTVAILREYEADPRFHWLSERDRGQADAINKGWARCHGDVLCWLNSDDVYLNENAVRIQAKVLLASPEVGLVYGDGYFADVNGHILRSFPTRPYEYSALFEVAFIVQPTVFVRRDIVQRVGPVDTSFHFAMDHNYWLRCVAITSPKYVPSPIATYRLHEDSKTVSQTIEINLDTTWAVCKHFSHEGRQLTTPGQRREIMGGLLLSLAIRALRESESAYAWQLVRGARHLTLRNLRYLQLPLTLLDQHLGLRLEGRLAERAFSILQQFRMRRRGIGDSVSSSRVPN